MVELGLLFVGGIGEMHRHFIAEVLSDLLQSQASSLREEEVYNCTGLAVGPVPLRMMGICLSLPGMKNMDQQMMTR